LIANSSSGLNSTERLGSDAPKKVSTSATIYPLVGLTSTAWSSIQLPFNESFILNRKALLSNEMSKNVSSSTATYFFGSKSTAPSSSESPRPTIKVRIPI
jgi:hypothetical protein